MVRRDTETGREICCTPEKGEMLWFRGVLKEFWKLTRHVPGSLHYQYCTHTHTRVRNRGREKQGATVLEMRSSKVCKVTELELRVPREGTETNIRKRQQRLDHQGRLYT